MTYETDLFAAPWDAGDHRSNDLADYVTFARTVRECNDIELLLQFVELAIPGGQAARNQAMALYRRWAIDVLTVVRAQPAIRHLAA